MVRSYVVTFAFVAFRIIQDGVGRLATVDFEQPSRYPRGVAGRSRFLLTEFVIQGRKVLRTPRRALPALLQ